MPLQGDSCGALSQAGEPWIACLVSPPHFSRATRYSKCSPQQSRSPAVAVGGCRDVLVTVVHASTVLRSLCAFR